MIEPKKIKEINFSDNIYFIPSYQRGYRWDKKQVEELLEDIYEVYTTNQKSYCLQPIVVSKIDKNENKYEIIDGQQRLTTIYILLTRFKRFIDEKFQLDFEVRKNCIEFFQKLDTGILDYSNPDFAHISNAYKVIDLWLKKKREDKVDSNIEMNIFQTLLEKVEVIWYDVEINDRKELVKVFTRLNSGKIGLTNAELIKALFLSKINFDSSKDVYTRQLDISNKWNQIENALQDDDFWNFINKSENKLTTRIDYIFQLIVRNKQFEIKEDFDVFRYYYPLYVKAQRESEYDFIESNWNEVDLYFTILQDWYKNHEYYHLIGLLIWDGLNILTLIKEYQKSNKTLFVRYLFKEIENRFCITIKDLDYKKSYNQVERTLVFFNVMEVYRSKSNKFPFKQLKLKEVKWSLEHIHPQNALAVRQHEYKQWLKDHKNVLESMNSDDNKELIERIKNLLTELEEKNAKDLKLQFEELSREILEKLDYKENNTENISKKSAIPYEKLIGEHHISNMALLDTKRNSSLGNSAFGVKRKSIIDFELMGVYIPNATKNSFLKYYSDYPKHLNYWTLEDRDEYLFKIQEQMNFIKNYNSENNEC